MNNEEKFTVPAATFTEKPDEYELKVQIPGIAKEDVDLHVEGRTLMLRTRSRFQNPAGFKQVAFEFERGNYAMSADLPEMADPSALGAKLENGVLFVTIGKRPETKPRKIDIA